MITYNLGPVLNFHVSLSTQDSCHAGQAKRRKAGASLVSVEGGSSLVDAPLGSNIGRRRRQSLPPIAGEGVTPALLPSRARRFQARRLGTVSALGGDDDDDGAQFAVGERMDNQRPQAAIQELTAANTRYHLWRCEASGLCMPRGGREDGPEVRRGCRPKIRPDFAWQISDLG